jgi:hypothetical protein
MHFPEAIMHLQGIETTQQQHMNYTGSTTKAAKRFKERTQIRQATNR